MSHTCASDLHSSSCTATPLDPQGSPWSSSLSHPHTLAQAVQGDVLVEDQAALERATHVVVLHQVRRKDLHLACNAAWHDTAQCGTATSGAAPWPTPYCNIQAHAAISCQFL
jgi:hypothetical protein